MEGSSTLSSLIGTGAEVAVAMAGNGKGASTIQRVSYQAKQAAYNMERQQRTQNYQSSQRQAYQQPYQQRQTQRYDGRHVLYYHVQTGNILHVEVNPNRSQYLDPVMISVNPNQQRYQQQQQYTQPQYQQQQYQQQQYTQQQRYQTPTTQSNQSGQLLQLAQQFFN